MSFLYGFSPFCHITWETVKKMLNSQFFLFFNKKKKYSVRKTLF